MTQKFRPYKPWPVVISALFTLSACGGDQGQDSVKKKIMADLYYAYEEDDNSGGEIEASLARALELYALDPNIFGDPVGIVFEFADSAALSPGKRQMALIVTDRTRELPAGIMIDSIPGGPVLSYACRSEIKNVNACWGILGRQARERGFDCIPPGIEVYKDFEVESLSDTAIIELIIKIE